MFDKHKDAQTTALNDIQTEVRSLKSLLAKRQVQDSQPASSAAIGTNGFTSGTSSLANSGVLPQQPTPSPFASTTTNNNGKSAMYSSPPMSLRTGSRFGLSSSTTMPDLPSAASGNGSAGASVPSLSVLPASSSSTSTSTPTSLPHSRSFDHIVNRPPGIPAWQRQDASSSSTGVARAATPSTSSTADSSITATTADSENKAEANPSSDVAESSSDSKSVSVAEEE